MKHLIVTVIAACAIGWWLGQSCAISDETMRQAASALASVGATMLGFVLAILAILVSLADRRLIRNMHRTGHFALLLSRLFSIATYFGVLTVAGLVALLMSGASLRAAIALSTGVALSSFIQLVYAGRTLWRVLERLMPQDGNSLE